MQALHRLMGGRTTFMIAHRLSTLEVCSLRLHLEHGRVIDRRVARGQVDREVALQP